MSQSKLLFVYGTLQHGECRFHLLEDQEFLGTAETLPQYRLVHCGSYPGLLCVRSNGRAIQGEVWRVSAARFKLLDEAEGVDIELYARREIQLAAPFDSASIEAYFYLPDATQLPDCGTAWKLRPS